MNALARYNLSQNSNPRCADLMMTMAQRELASFFLTVTQFFGSEQAKRSAEDWLEELNLIGRLPASTREWRSITVKASTRLASRVSPSSPTPNLQMLRR
jgi:hypothetical protein